MVLVLCGELVRSFDRQARQMGRELQIGDEGSRGWEKGGGDLATFLEPLLPRIPGRQARLTRSRCP